MGAGFGRFEDPFDARRDLLEGVIVDVVDELARRTPRLRLCCLSGSIAYDVLGDLGDSMSL